MCLPLFVTVVGLTSSHTVQGLFPATKGSRSCILLFSKHSVSSRWSCCLHRCYSLPILLSSNCPQPCPLFLAIILHSPAKILYPLLVGSRCDPNEEIPDFGSHCEPKVRVSHSFGSRCEPKTGDLTSGSSYEPRE